jgi:hypothetical protein
MCRPVAEEGSGQQDRPTGPHGRHHCTGGAAGAVAGTRVWLGRTFSASALGSRVREGRAAWLVWPA